MPELSVLRQAVAALLAPTLILAACVRPPLPSAQRTGPEAGPVAAPPSLAAPVGEAPPPAPEAPSEGAPGALAVPPTAGAAEPSIEPGAAPPGGEPSSAIGGGSSVVPVDADDIVWGSATAPVTLVEFTDLECPFCARVVPTLERLMERYGPSRLRVVIKHYPLAFHRWARGRAQVAAAVRAAHGSEAALRFLAHAFAHQRDLVEDGATAVAALGLDADRVRALAAAPSTVAAVDADLRLVERLGLRGTPAFLVNGVHISGARPLGDFTAVIDAELAAAADLARAGVPAEAVYRSRVAVNWQPPARREPGERPAKPTPPDTTVHFVPTEGAPAVGPRDALVTVVEFFDHQCPFCKRVEETRQALLARYPAELRWVMRHNPLPFHQQARPAATLALEARRQRGDAGYFEATRRLFELSPELDELRLLELGTALGLKMDGVRRALDRGAHDAAIDADVDLAADLGARGTPHFFINGRRLAGAQPLERFVALIDERLAAARVLVDGGVPRRAVYSRIMEGAQRPAAPERREVRIPRGAPSRGPATAPVVIQMFGDFQCPYCKKAAATMTELQQKFPGQVRVVWRHLPLAFHERARRAAAAAHEARAQRGDAGFFALHDRLFESLGTPDALSDAALRREAEAVALDLARFDAALADGRHEAAIAADERAAQEAGFDATPTFLVNGVLIEGAQPIGVFARAVRRALAEKRQRPAAP